MIYDATLNLAQIAGLSPYNVRQSVDPDDDIAQLKASIRARGMIYRPVVHLDPETKAYLVLDGGRRWRARREIIIEDGHDPDLTPFDVAVISGATPAELIALSTTGNIMARAMHPVREYEAFAAIAAASRSEEAAIEAITREFGLTRKMVRQRLALGALSPKIRAAWLDGKISPEEARAYAECPDIAAQEAFFDNPANNYACDQPRAIRRALLSDFVDATDAVLRFIGEDAYRAAGGVVHDSLFEDERRFSGALVRKLTREKLAVEGERLRAAEGWGFAIVAEDGDDYDETDYTPDYLADEEKRLAELNVALSKLVMGEGGDRRAIRAEIDAIDGRATMRAIPAAERLGLGILVDYDHNGGLLVTRAIEGADTSIIAERDPDPTDAEAAAPAPARECVTPSGAVVEAPEPIGKQLRTVLDETCAGALHDATARSVNLALVFAVAKLGATYGGEALDLHMHARRAWTPTHPLLQSIAHQPFAAALAVVAAAPFNDVTTAFCELIGAAIDPSRAAELAPTLRLVAAAAAIPVAIEADLKRHFDAADYFRAATKDAALAALRELDGETAAAEAGKLKKPDLVERVALVAKDRQWLPKSLRDALPAAQIPAAFVEPAGAAPPSPASPGEGDRRSLAEAMADAIDADEGAAPDAPPVGLADHVKTFIAEECADGPKEDVKASVFRAAYNVWAQRRNFQQATTVAMAEILGRLGYDKHRFKTGVYYAGIGLLNEPYDAAKANAEAAQ